VVRTPLKELLGQLDAEQFAQVHRSVVVNLARDQPCEAARQRNGGNSLEGPKRGSPGEP